MSVKRVKIDVRSMKNASTQKGLTHVDAGLDSKGPLMMPVLISMNVKQALINARNSKNASILLDTTIVVIAPETTVMLMQTVLIASLITNASAKKVFGVVELGAK